MLEYGNNYLEYRAIWKSKITKWNREYAPQSQKDKDILSGRLVRILYFIFFNFLKYKFIYFHWRLITLQYCFVF